MGDLRLTSMARMPKSSTWRLQGGGRRRGGRWKGDGRWEGDRREMVDGTWMDAPAAYQKGPEIPKFHATLDDWRRVAAHVHCDTMTCAGYQVGVAVRQNPRDRDRGRGRDRYRGRGDGAEGVRTWVGGLGLE